MQQDNKGYILEALENKITEIVREYLIQEKREKTTDKKLAYKRKYRSIESALGKPEVNATQVMARALGFSPSDDAKRSEAFKKLHREKTPDGSGEYQFTDEEIGKLFRAVKGF